MKIWKNIRYRRPEKSRFAAVLLCSLFLWAAGAQAATLNLNGNLKSVEIHNDTIKLEDAEVKTGETAEFISSDAVQIKKPFHAKNGSNFRAKTSSKANHLRSSSYSHYRPQDCSGTEQDLFMGYDDPDSSTNYIEIKIEANFDIINDPDIPFEDRDTAMDAFGTFRYKDPDTGQWITMNDATVAARGKSRYRNCTFRPLKVHLYYDDMEDTIFDNSNGYLADNTLKFVTHCLNHYEGYDLEESRRRLFQEYYQYRVMDPLDTANLRTKLAKVTYQNTADGSEFTEWAFFREKEQIGAYRCGGKERVEEIVPEKPFQENMPYAPDPVSHYQATFHYYFGFNNDQGLDFKYTDTGDDIELRYREHNVVLMKPATESEPIYFIPYDWDLSGVISPDWVKNIFKTMQSNAEEMVQALSYNGSLGSWYSNPQIAAVQSMSLYENKSEMMAIVNDGFFPTTVNGTTQDTEGRARLQEWLEITFDALWDYF